MHSTECDFTDYGAEDGEAEEGRLPSAQGAYRAIREGVVTLLPSIVGFGLALLLSGAVNPLFSRPAQKQLPRADAGRRKSGEGDSRLGTYGGSGAAQGGAAVYPTDGAQYTNGYVHEHAGAAPAGSAAVGIEGGKAAVS